MKKGIHPEYHRIMVKCTSCGAEFETGSTAKELRVDTCSNCHPFFTISRCYILKKYLGNMIISYVYFYHFPHKFVIIDTVVMR